jgi:hypothetical protein
MASHNNPGISWWGIWQQAQSKEVSDIGIAVGFALDVHDVPDDGGTAEGAHVQWVVERDVDEGSYSGSPSGHRVEVRGLRVLPLPPDAIEVGVVEVEKRIL